MTAHSLKLMTVLREEALAFPCRCMVETEIRIIEKIILSYNFLYIPLDSVRNPTYNFLYKKKKLYDKKGWPE